MSRGESARAAARFGRVCLGLAAGFVLGLIMNGCGSDPGPAAPLYPPVQVDVQARRPALLLSEYRLFTDAEGRIPNRGVLPYSLNSSHYADDAQIGHYMYVPPDSPVVYHETGPFGFPKGTILIQHLGFPADARDPSSREHLVETRLLLHQDSGWVAVAYRWNDEGTEARRAVVGGKTPVQWVTADGRTLTHEWVTPDMNQCKRCHGGQGSTGPIGTTARNLNRSSSAGSVPRNQLSDWRERGLLEGLPSEAAAIPEAPAWNDPTTGSIDERARTWLDVNCAHCHNPQGPANVSGLDLSIHQHIPVKYGVYKPPVAAGRGSQGSRFSIHPADPADSFLLHRIRSLDPGVMMPTVGRSRVDEEGAALIEQWIREMSPNPAKAAQALDPVSAYQGALRGGNAERGRALFYGRGVCVVCHTADEAKGGTIGPNLAHVGARSTRQELLESILVPSAVLADGYATTTLTLDTDQTLFGRIAGEDAYEVVLALSDGSTVTIPSESIRRRETSPASIMPSVAATFPVEDVRDLVEFLSSCRNPDA